MYHVIVNPASRSGRGQKIWKEQIEPALQRENVAYCPHFSEKAGDTVSIVANLFRRETGDVFLIILGGDGTVNEALQGMDDPRRAVLGYIPTGSSNDLARDLKLPRKPLEALDVILHSGRVRSMDLGVLSYADGETRRFAVSCGIGFDAAVCQEAMHSKIKDTMNRLGLGKLTYLGVALRQLFASKAVSGKLTLEGGAPVDIGNMLFTACMVHRFEGGGFMFCPKADPCDGFLDIFIAEGLPKLKILFLLPTAFFGKHTRFSGIHTYRCRRADIKSAVSLPIHTDGEPVLSQKNISAYLAPQKIRLIIS